MYYTCIFQLQSADICTSDHQQALVPFRKSMVVSIHRTFVCGKSCAVQCGFTMPSDEQFVLDTDESYTCHN